MVVLVLVLSSDVATADDDDCDCFSTDEKAVCTGCAATQVWSVLVEAFSVAIIKPGSSRCTPRLIVYLHISLVLH